jgi:hypothetical protein
MSKKIPLELRWRQPQELPGPDDEVEIAFCRYLDQTLRVTVAPVERAGPLPHPLAPTTRVPGRGRGWVTKINGEEVGEIVDFLDACYQGWASFVETVPRLARHLTLATDQRSKREGWDLERMVQQVAYDYSAADAAPAEPLAGGDGGLPTGPRDAAGGPDSGRPPGPEPDAGTVWPAPWTPA